MATPGEEPHSAGEDPQHINLTREKCVFSFFQLGNQIKWSLLGVPAARKMGDLRGMNVTKHFLCLEHVVIHTPKSFRSNVRAPSPEILCGRHCARQDLIA